MIRLLYFFQIYKNITKVIKKDYKKELVKDIKVCLKKKRKSGMIQNFSRIQKKEEKYIIGKHFKIKKRLIVVITHYFL